MSRLRIMVVLLFAVFAIAAVVSASASAALPAFYECAKTEKVGKGKEAHYTGKYSDDKCETAEPKGEGEYELEEFGNEKPKEFKGKGGGINWSIEGLSTFSCAKSSETGRMSGPKTVRGVVITMTDCDNAGLDFTNTEVLGEVKTKPLSGEIGYFDEDKGKTVSREVGLVLRPESGTYLAEFHSVGAPQLNVRWKGAVIAEIEPGPKSAYNKMSKEVELNLEEVGGEQGIQNFEGGLKETLITENCKACEPTLPEENTAWSTKIVDKGEELMLEE